MLLMIEKSYESLTVAHDSAKPFLDKALIDSDHSR